MQEELTKREKKKIAQQKYKEMCQELANQQRKKRVRPDKSQRTKAFEAAKRAINADRQAWTARPNRAKRRGNAGGDFLPAIRYVQSGPKPGSKGPKYYTKVELE